MSLTMGRAPTLFDRFTRPRAASPTYNRRLEQWREFHRRHPEVYAMFREKAIEARAQQTRYSARTIFEVVRWHYTVNERRDGGFKLNNNYFPEYARLLISEDPNFDGFFELRGENGNPE